MNQEEETNVDLAQIGRVLHFVTEAGKCRPSIVVEDWPNSGHAGYVNIVVFPDGTNDSPYGKDVHRHHLGGEHQPEFTAMANLPLLTRWETSVNPNHAIKAYRTWHWPRECSNLANPPPPFVEESQIIHHNHAEGLEDVHNCYACKRMKAANESGK